MSDENFKITRMFFSPQEVALMLGCSLKTIYRRLTKGLIAKKQIGGARHRIFISRDVLTEQLEAKKDAECRGAVQAAPLPVNEKKVRQPNWRAKKGRK